MNTTKVTHYPKLFVFLGYAYLFTYYVRPQSNIPGLDAIPWVGVLFLLFTVWSLFYIRVNVLSTPLVLIALLAGWFALTGIGAISVISYKISWHWGSQVFPQCVGLYLIFNGHLRIKSLLNWWCIIYFFMAMITITKAPLGPGDFTRDPNDASLALSMGLPFLFYALEQSDLSKMRKYFYYVTIVLIFIAIIMTGSRGGFLGLVAVILTIWWLSRNRMKSAIYGLAAACTLGLAVLAMLPDGYLDEMKSISDTEDSTRVERVRTWEIGWLMFKDKPFVGVGVGNFSNTVHLYQDETSWWTGEQKSLSGRQSHSLYFQILPELGIVGILLYGYIMIVAPFKLLSLNKKVSGSDESDELVRILCKALIASMASYAIAGAFISVAYYPHIPIWVAMYAITIGLSRSTKKWEVNHP